MPFLLRLALSATFLLACACQGATDEGDPPPTPRGLDDETGLEPNCAGEAPQITAFTAVADGLATFEQQTYPVILLTIKGADPDGDLGEVYYEIWFDDHVDGLVDTSGSPDHDQYTTLNAERCDTTSATITVQLAANGWLETNTWYDFAARISDYAGMTSGIAVTTGGTPKDDGADPDPQG